MGRKWGSPLKSSIYGLRLDEHVLGRANRVVDMTAGATLLGLIYALSVRQHFQHAAARGGKQQRCI